MFSFNIPVIAFALCGGAVIFSIFFLMLVLRKLRRVSRRAKACGKLTMPADDEFPPVSVIVHDDARAWNLPLLLPALLEQDYPAPMEVIVVNDGARAASEEAVARLDGKYPNLYMTFLPGGSRSLSRRKLALMLGIKAARYDNVALIGGHCIPDSNLWLRTMMRHMARGKQLVIGWAYPTLRDGFPAKGGARRRAFDLVRTAVQYLAWAAAGHPWRGTGFNMAFARDLFYENKGFASTLNLVRGDDDIWVKEVATKANTAVELAPESMVTIQEDDLKAAHKADKISHDFTSRKPGRVAHFTFGLASFCWWLAIGCAVAGSVLALPSLIPLCAMAVIACAVCLPLMFRWRRASVALKSRPLFLTVPWFVTWHPFYSLGYKIYGRAKRRDHYTSGKLR